MEIQHLNFSDPNWELRFSYPAGWEIVTGDSGEASTHLAIMPRGEDKNDPPAVRIEVRQESLASDMGYLLDAALLRLNAELPEFSLVNRAIQPVRGEPRGILLVQFKMNGKDHVAQKVLFPLTGGKFAEITAQATSESWAAHKNAFQLVLRSLQKGTGPAAPLTPPEKKSDFEILFASSEVTDSKPRKRDPEPIELLVKLLQQDYGSRNFAWQSKVYEQISRSTFHVPRDPVFRGSDGYSYQTLLTAPSAGVPILRSEPFPKLIKQITEEGLGASIDPQAPHTMAFCFGDLWYFREVPGYKPFLIPESWNRSETGGSQLIGTPSAEILPMYARLALKSHLKYVLKIEKPSVYLSIQSGTNPPKRALCFNLFEEDCASSEEYQAKLQSLLWFLPNDLVLGAPTRRSFPAEAAISL